MRDLSKIIRDIEKLPYKNYESRRPKHDPTDSYFYLDGHIANCMMRADALNSHVDPVRTEITGAKHIPISHIFSGDDNESKEFLVDKYLLQIYYMD